MKNLNINFEKHYTYGKDSEICGTICVRYLGTRLMYLACGMCQSKWFKTLKGAERFMAQNGYTAA